MGQELRYTKKEIAEMDRERQRKDYEESLQGIVAQYLKERDMGIVVQDIPEYDADRTKRIGTYGQTYVFNHYNGDGPVKVAKIIRFKGLLEICYFGDPRSDIPFKEVAKVAGMVKRGLRSGEVDPNTSYIKELTVRLERNKGKKN